MKIRPHDRRTYQAGRDGHPDDQPAPEDTSGVIKDKSRNPD
jgi:hypothetical protein